MLFWINLLRFEPFALTATMWLLFFLVLFSPISVLELGIYPRQLSGLAGIFSAPFAHINLAHLVSNTVPLLILGSLVRAYGRAAFFQSLIIIIVIGGIGTWLLSSAGRVLGSSIIIFGFWAYLIARGWIDKRPLSIALALLTIFLYGSLFISFFKFVPQISWAGHASGVLGGVIAALYPKKLNKRHP